MKKKIIIISAIIGGVIGLYFLLKKPKLKKRLANSYTKSTEGDFIITIPDSNDKEFDVVYIFGGMAYATPSWMFKQVPKDIFLSNVVIFAPYTSNFGTAKIKLQQILSKRGIKTISNSLLGFSAGALDVLYNFSKNYKFIGLIDPSNKEELIDLDFGKNTFMVYNQSNWGSYRRIQRDMGTMAKNIRNKGGIAESVDLSHEDIPAYFFEKYGRYLTS